MIEFNLFICNFSNGLAYLWGSNDNNKYSCSFILDILMLKFWSSNEFFQKQMCLHKNAMAFYSNLILLKQLEGAIFLHVKTCLFWKWGIIDFSTEWERCDFFLRKHTVLFTSILAQGMSLNLAIHSFFACIWYLKWIVEFHEKQSKTHKTCLKGL